MPFVLLGHSAGAQFLNRVAAFVPTGAAGIIIANPSTWVLPSISIAAPYGFGGTASDTDDAVRAYLAQPITVLLGTADTGTKELAMSPSAMAQGPNRHARGLHMVRMAQDVANSHGWRLGWRLAEVPGVAHDATAMFNSAQALEAIRRAVPDACKMTACVSLTRRDHVARRLFGRHRLRPGRRRAGCALQDHPAAMVSAVRLGRERASVDRLSGRVPVLTCGVLSGRRLGRNRTAGEHRHQRNETYFAHRGLLCFRAGNVVSATDQVQSRHRVIPAGQIGRRCGSPSLSGPGAL